jgi:hypothetical protein
MKWLKQGALSVMEAAFWAVAGALLAFLGMALFAWVL